MTRIKNLLCPVCRDFPDHIIEDIDPKLTNNVPLQVITCDKCKKRYLDLILNKLTKYRLKWFLDGPKETQIELLERNNISLDDFNSLIKDGIDSIWKMIIKSKEDI